MTGADGSILKRPDSEESIEHDGMSHFFTATMADLDPFVGSPGKLDATKTISGWLGLAFCDRWGIIYLLGDQLSGHRGDDNHVLWPTRAELHEAYDSGVISWDELVVARLVATHCGHDHRLKVAAIEAGGCP